MRRDGTTPHGQFLRRLLLRHLGGTLIACIICAGWSSAQTRTQTAAQIHFRLQTREVVEAHLKSFSTKNSEREALIRRWFADAGCEDANLSEQSLERKLPPNVICVLPGETQQVVVVGAHTDKVESGDGVVDNWTGAVLLPALLYALSAAYYMDHLTNERRAHIEAMVNFDSLGLGPTKVWASHADKVLLDALTTTATSANLPLAAANVDNLGTADSESFARCQIPRITLHSVTQQTWSILHSPFDKVTAIKMGDYYESYKLAAWYLAYLDDVLKAPVAPHQ